MKLQDKLQGTINTIVGDAKQNVEIAKDQLNGVISEVVVAAKEEVELQKTAFVSYQERFAALKAKGFKKDEIVNDVKGEVAFFGNEIASTFNRNVEKFKSIVAPKVAEFKSATKKATEAVVEEVKNEVAE